MTSSLQEKSFRWYLVPVLAIVYFSSGLIAFELSVSSKTVSSAVFFPEGFSLAFLVLWGRQVIPGVFIGQLALAIFTGVSPIASILIGLGNSLELLAAWYVFRYYKAFETPPNMRDFLIFIATTVLVCQPISVLIGLTSLVIFDQPTMQNIPQHAIYWYFGNLIAQFLITPAILIWRLVFLEKMRILNLREFIIFLIILVMTLPHALGIFVPDYALSNIHIFSFIYPVLLWVSSRYELPGVTMVNVCIVIFIQISSALNRGPFASDDIIHNLLQLNLFNLTIVVSSTLLALLFYEKRKLQTKISLIANQDPLTNLLNRRRFYELARLYLKQQKRTHQFGAVLMIDIDNFKPINDQHGHETGDEIIIKLAHILNDSLREVDLKGRYGGEEFIVLLSPPVNLHTVIERLLNRIRKELKTHSPKGVVTATVSIGVKKIEASNDILDKLTSMADQALYKAKEQGKDRAVFYDELK